MLYPENTLQAFQAAAEIPGIRGIELDVQLTRDGTIVVIHDERIDRTTIGKGFVRDYTLAELKQLYITPSGRAEAYRDPKTGETCTIPTLQEVFDLLAPYCRTNGLKINIELKNSIYRYEGMEKLVVDMVAAYGLEDSIVYSSFLHESVGLVRELCPGAQTGTLAGDIFSCIEGMQKYHADALHPCNNGMGINPETVTMLKENRIPVRIWNSEEPFFGQSRVLKNCDLKKYVRLGATDLITNVPERYLPKKDMMNRVWAAQIEVMEEIRRVCDKHGLRFFADWGSLLGAVRHRGFIPWDDDLDIGMLREDYQRFLEIAPEELQAPFELKSLYNDPTHDNVKCRVITGRSMNFEPEYLARFHDCPYVVGVDIFPIDYITRDPEKLAQQEETIRFLMTAAASVPEQPPYDEKVLELADKIEKTVGKPINRKNRLSHELKRLVDEVSALYTSEDADEVCSMIDLAMGWDYHAGKEWYAGSVEMPFENTTIPVPVGYDGILKIKYGADYMIPRGGGGSHDYPFYRKQADGLKAQIEQEMKITLTDEELDLLIEEKINSCKGATAGFLGDE
jgi:glycerophosphoryl diester phosphodiesterase/phosphorylcholine metabolism protein LicD